MLVVLAARWLIASTHLEAAQPESRVVVVVWDGMRPDFVTQQHTPTLHALAGRGVRFANHHCVFPSATSVNGTAIFTGVCPGRSDILANHEYRPSINRLRPLGVSTLEAVRSGDVVSDGKFVAVPTVAEIVQQAGRRTAVAGAKTVALLADRTFQSNKLPSQISPVLFAGAVRPFALHEKIVAAIGPFPPARAFPLLAQNVWTTQALTDHLWRSGVPAFSLLWLGEPDASQHETGPGSQTALEAIKTSDDNLRMVLDALEKKGVLARTDVIVVSDHGFSTIERSIDLVALLREAGFDAKRKFSTESRNGEILVAGNSGTSLLYVANQDARVTQKVVEFLQRSDFAGAIFTRQPIQGTFPFDKARIATHNAPDVLVSFRWADRPNTHGVQGSIIVDDVRAAGQGGHGTLSKFDMHNTLVAAGPHFRKGWVDELPSGNIDLAPTILHILAIAPPSAMDGRVLNEALVEPGADTAQPQTHEISATREFADCLWRQHLRFTTLGDTVYFDEAVGGSEPR
jgi:arylsulfatase A-like enzyme